MQSHRVPLTPMCSGLGEILRGVKGEAIAESEAALDAPQNLPYPLSMGVRGTALITNEQRIISTYLFPERFSLSRHYQRQWFIRRPGLGGRVDVRCLLAVGHPLENSKYQRVGYGEMGG